MNDAVITEAPTAYLGGWGKGWRGCLLALLAGALTAFAVPPLNLVFLWPVGLPLLILLLEDAGDTRKRAALLAWLFGFGHFGLHLYWISFSLFTDIARFWFLLPFVALGLPAFLGLIWMGLGLLWPELKRFFPPVPRLFVFALLLFTLEWLRGHMLTGFPWGLAGYGWLGVLPVAQLASVIGVYGLTLLTFLLSVLPAMHWLAPRKQARRALSLAAALLVLAGIWGQYRLSTLPEGQETETTLRLVQPNIDQSQKWNTDLARQHMATLMRLSQGAPVDIVIWPETAIPFDPTRVSGLDRMMADLDGASLLITGAQRIDLQGTEDRRDDLFYNSVQVINAEGQVAAVYDKFHLVPFGEYMPLRNVLPLDAIAAGPVDFQTGPGPQSLRAQGLPTVSPLICYEIIFPAAVADRQDRPDWLLTVTNDGWFGKSAGPHQHFSMARMRAIEEGLPMVRVANTGVTGIVDAAGRIMQQTPLLEEAVINANLPPKAQPTLFSRFENASSLAVILLVMVSAFIATKGLKTVRKGLSSKA